MNKQDIKHIGESLAVIIGQPMRYIGRSGSMIIVNFGELVEVDTLQLDDNGRVARDEDGKTIPIKNMEGRYALDALCSMRFTCGDEVIFAKSDIFLPTAEQTAKPNFVWDTFDWNTTGNTSFDEIIRRHFNGKFDEYIVKAVDVSKFGDLSITFENNFEIYFFADGSGYSENWNFSGINSAKPIITLTGIGIYSE